MSDQETEFVPSNGLAEGMPMADYREAEGVSASDLKNLSRSAAYAHMQHRTLSESTAAQEWGTAVHTAILEPDELEVRYGLDPEPPEGASATGWRNTTRYKALRFAMMHPRQFNEKYAPRPEGPKTGKKAEEAKAAAKLERPSIEVFLDQDLYDKCWEVSTSYDACEPLEGLLTSDEFTQLEWIQKRVADSEFGEKLSELHGIREGSVFAYDEEFGLWRKCRPDWYVPDAMMSVDIKKVADHRAFAFSKACHTYGYHLSAAWYIDTMSMAGCPVDHNPFLTINGTAPFEVQPYTLDSDSIDQGRHEYRKALRQWCECVETGRWVAGNGDIEEIRIPEYAIDFQYEK